MLHILHSIIERLKDIIELYGDDYDYLILIYLQMNIDIDLNYLLIGITTRNLIYDYECLI